MHLHQPSLWFLIKSQIPELSHSEKYQEMSFFNEPSRGFGNVNYHPSIYFFEIMPFSKERVTEQQTFVYCQIYMCDFELLKEKELIPVLQLNEHYISICF